MINPGFRSIAYVLACLLALGCYGATSANKATTAEWTVLVYMNGNNDLASFIEGNFDQMRAASGSNSVNIVLEFARAQWDPLNKQWVSEGAYRMRVKPDTREASEKYAESKLGTVDMGSPQALQNFIAWAVPRYPAKHFFLIIWNHGQGYRAEKGIGGSPIGIPTAAPFRSVSSDYVSGKTLYVRQIVDALTNVEATVPGLRHQPIDIIGFDACLMAMVENAYAFRTVAKFMVASQELEPGEGWEYNGWMSALAQNSKMSAADLGKKVVDAYRVAWMGHDDQTTLSETDLSHAVDLAHRVSDLGKALTDSEAVELTTIKAMRAACPTFAPKPYASQNGDPKDYFFYVDMGCVAGKVQTMLKSDAAHVAAAAVDASLKTAVIANYTGSSRTSFGTSGLTIYFPETKTQFDNDVFAEDGYSKSNKKFPVEFVRDPQILWADFLASYYPKLDSLQ